MTIELLEDLRYFVSLSIRYNDNEFRFNPINIRIRQYNYLMWLRTRLTKKIKDPFLMTEVDNIIKMEDLNIEQKLQLCRTYFE